MTYPIEPVYFIFPAVCLLISLVKPHTGKHLSSVLGTAFIFVYSFSMNGADYTNYKILYNAIATGHSLTSVHGEIGYNILVWICCRLGISYPAFRLLLLVTVSVVMLVAVYKISDNFGLSMFFITSMFLIYTISAYRQFIVMAFSLLWMYVFSKGQHRKAIIGTLFLPFFHISALVPLGLMILFDLVPRQRTERAIVFIRKNIYYLAAIACVLRVLNTVLLKMGPVRAIVAKILAGHASPQPTLFTFGLVSRVAFIILLGYMYSVRRPKDELTHMLYWYYMFGMLIYVAVPLELFMGRLMNNVNILSAVLVPLLLYGRREPAEKDPHLSAETGHKLLNNLKLSATALVLVAFAVLLSQLLKQGGYYPYANILSSWF